MRCSSNKAAPDSLFPVGGYIIRALSRCTITFTLTPTHLSPVCQHPACTWTESGTGWPERSHNGGEEEVEGEGGEEDERGVERSTSKLSV